MVRRVEGPAHRQRGLKGLWKPARQYGLRTRSVSEPANSELGIPLVSGPGILDPPWVQNPQVSFSLTCRPRGGLWISRSLKVPNSLLSPSSFVRSLKATTQQHSCHIKPIKLLGTRFLARRVQESPVSSQLEGIHGQAVFHKCPRS